MITQVFDDKGELVHDCKAAGCDVSWDGYNIVDGTPAANRKDPDTAVWAAQGPVARLKPRPVAR